MELSDRKIQILNTLIDAYIECCEPIPSKSSVFDKFNLSSATLRNEMASLEEAGFLFQPHISAGRIPSNLGYKLYVDYLINSLEIDNFRKQDINRLLEEQMVHSEHFLANSAMITASLTNCASVLIKNIGARRKLMYFKCIPIDLNRVAVMAVAGTNNVKTKMFVSRYEMNLTDYTVANRILNIHLTSKEVASLTDDAYTEIELEFQRYVPTMMGITQTIKSLVKDLNDVEIIVCGESNLLAYPEFCKIERLKDFYSVISNKAELPNLIPDSNDGISVVIDPDYLPNSSLITTSISTNENERSTLSVIGPMRMNYSRIISDIKCVSDALIDRLENIEKGKKGD